MSFWASTDCPACLPTQSWDESRQRLERRRIAMMLAHITEEDLNAMRELIESGRVRPVVDRIFPLDETANAIRYIEGEKNRPGHAREKVIVSMDKK